MSNKVLFGSIAKKFVDDFDLIVDLGNILGATKAGDIDVNVSVGNKLATFMKLINLDIKVFE